MSFLSSLQFANLGAFFAAICIPLLVLAYLKKQSRKESTVSSVLILKTLSKKVTLKRRFRPPLRFFLELLALLLLLTAAARPGAKNLDTPIAILLDTTMSMRAQTGSGTTRLELARSKLEAWLENEAPLANRYTLFRSSPKLEQVGDTFFTKASVIGAIAKLSPSYTGDSLSIAAQELARSGNYKHLVVLTDRTASYTQDESSEASELQQTNLEVLELGSPASNIFISDIKIERSSLDATKKEAVLSFGASGTSPVASSLEVSLDTKGTGSTIYRKEILISPDAQLIERVPLPPTSKSDKIVRAELSLRDASKTELDALIEDNTAWSTLSESGAQKLLIVSPTASNNDFGFSAFPSLEVQHLSPEMYAVLDESKLKDFDLVFFHQSAPTKIPPTPSLLILPPNENVLFPVQKELPRCTIASWNESHAITSYLNVPLLKPRSGLIFALPPWSQSILNAEEGALIAAGELRGRRHASVGFEILPFEGSKTPAPSVLTLNLLSWLLGGSDFTSAVLSGSSMRLDGGKKWIIQDPAGERSMRDVPGEQTEFFALPKPGIYQISERSYQEGKSSEKSSWLLAVNSFHPRESSTYANAPLALPRSAKHIRSEQKQDTPLWHYLIWAVLGITLLELLLAMKGRAE